eukprot:4975028-Amphidinium_carterae.1
MQLLIAKLIHKIHPAKNTNQPAQIRNFEAVKYRELLNLVCSFPIDRGDGNVILRSATPIAQSRHKGTEFK